MVLFTRLAPKYPVEATSLLGVTPWLEAVRTPGGADGQTVEFVTLTLTDLATDQACLTDALAALRLDPRQVVVRNDTIDFNRHHAHDTADDVSGISDLDMYSIADNEWGICWIFDPVSRSIRGLTWHLQREGELQANFVLETLSQIDLKCVHALAPALLTLQVENRAMRTWVDNQSQAMTDLQIQTGHHLYVDAPYFAGGLSQLENAKAMDLETMTKKICGLAVNVTTSALCMQRLVQLADFILEEAHETKTTPPPSHNAVLDPTDILIQRTRSAKREAQGLLLEAQSWQHKGDIFVQTLLSLTTQRDQQLSISIAADSRILAQKATRDSTSMKAIAAVTMCFLPGTFVASMFAMPMFDWDAGVARSVNRHFWIYWAVTLPLTAGVVAVWLCWTNKERLRARLRRHRGQREQGKVE